MDNEDPRKAYPQPPQPKQQQEPPGTERKLDPPPDHGEQSYKGSGKLQGKAALITGADSGIGRAVAIAFAREGADVLISYLCEDEDARETARWVEQAGRRAVLMPGDVSDPAHCRALVDRAVREFGKLDVLVNNAAYQMTFKSLDEISDEEWDKTFRTNIYSMFYPVEGGGEAHEARRRDRQHDLDQRQDRRTRPCWPMRRQKARSPISRPASRNCSRSRASGSTASRRDRSGRR